MISNMHRLKLRLSIFGSLLLMLVAARGEPGMVFAFQADSISATVTTFETPRELYEAANEKLGDADYARSLFYLSAYLYTYPDDRNRAMVAESLDDLFRINERNRWLLQQWERTCLLRNCTGTDKEAAGLNYTFHEVTNGSFPPMPEYEDEFGSRLGLICRGGGEMRFILQAQRPAATVWVGFEAGTRRGREDYENVYRLQPGQCTLLVRKIRDDEQSWLNFGPLLEIVENFAVSWDASGEVSDVGPGIVSLGRSLGPNPKAFEVFQGALEAAGENAAGTLSPWQALEDLKSDRRYAEFRVDIDTDNSFVATRVVEYGPWSKYERIEIEFQNGRRPQSSYNGATDSTISQDEPTARLGQQDPCFVDGDDPPGTGREKATLLRWDISAIPAGSTIKTAAITLDVVNTTQNEYQVYALKRNWSESQATWRSYRSGSRWQQTGAAGNADRDRTVLGSFTLNTLGRRTFTLNAAGIGELQEWLDRPSSNHGIILMNPDAIDGLDFSCSEATTVADRPFLKIDYTR